MTATEGVAVAVLAAGRSARFGRAKQLEPVRGTPLLRRVAEAALASGASRVIVVLGHEAPRCREVLRGLDVVVVENDAWQEGVASSVRASASAAGDARALVVTPADLPEFASAVVDALIEAWERDGAPPLGRVACRYEGVLGAPALFGRARFAELASLRGDRGARDVLRAAEDVVEIPWEPGSRDLDTPDMRPERR